MKHSSSSFFLLLSILLYFGYVTFSSVTLYILATFGGIVVAYFFLDTILTFLQLIRSLLAPLFILNEDDALVKKFGSWALITGSTDGIGRAYAFELAKRGINLVLVSRNLEKLKSTARDIEEKHNTKTKIIAADFSLGPKAVDIVKSELGDLPIDILVNNVGKNYEYPMYLHEVDEKELWDIISINIGAVTLLTRFFVEQMQKRRRGAIVNISSGSQHQPLPLMTVYAATKAYIKSFTDALRCECARDGVYVQLLAPMFVGTKMNHFSDKIGRKRGLFVPDPEGYAGYAAALLGRVDESSGYWSHGVQTFFIKLMPVWIRTYVGFQMNRMFRKEYLKEKKLLKEVYNNPIASEHTILDASATELKSRV